MGFRIQIYTAAPIATSPRVVPGANLAMLGGAPGYRSDAPSGLINRFFHYLSQKTRRVHLVISYSAVPQRFSQASHSPQVSLGVLGVLVVNDFDST